MRFMVDGAWMGRHVRLSWTDGTIEAPAGLPELLRFHAELRQDGLGPPLIGENGDRYDLMGLSDPTASLLLIRQLLSRVDRVVWETEPQQARRDHPARGRLRSVRTSLRPV